MEVGEPHLHSSVIRWLRTDGAAFLYQMSQPRRNVLQTF